MTRIGMFNAPMFVCTRCCGHACPMPDVCKWFDLCSWIWNYCNSTPQPRWEWHKMQSWLPTKHLNPSTSSWRCAVGTYYKYNPTVCIYLHLLWIYLHCLIRTLAIIAVVLQQLGAARKFAGGVVCAVGTLRRSCKALQMPPHRNVHSSNSRTRNVVIVIIHAFTICEY